MSVRVLNWNEIEPRLAGLDLLALMEEGFAQHSAGRSVIPPVGELVFEDPPGEVHLKYGYLRGGEHYVVKIASGFYENPKLGISSSQGLMLLFDQRTGELRAVLLDEGHLTDIRTGAAGAVAARHLAPSEVEAIGVLGTGIQAREQLRQLAGVTTCRNVVAWGRNPDHLDAYLSEARAWGFDASPAGTPTAVAEQCNLIVTTTASTIPLLPASAVRPGTHITAVGSDTPAKQELEAQLLAAADVVVADCRKQCSVRGEIHRAVQAGVLDPACVLELGDVVAGRTTAGRSRDEDITIADLTGVAVQDLQIASGVLARP